MFILASEKIQLIEYWRAGNFIDRTINRLITKLNSIGKCIFFLFLSFALHSTNQCHMVHSIRANSPYSNNCSHRGQECCMLVTAATATATATTTVNSFTCIVDLSPPSLAFSGIQLHCIAFESSIDALLIDVCTTFDLNQSVSTCARSII